MKKNQQPSDDDYFFQFVNVVPEHTGLPVLIWISSKMGNQEPRIMVQADYSTKLKREPLFSVSISDEPATTGNTGVLSEIDIQLLKNFVKINKNTLLEYWYETDIDIVNILSKLKRV